MGMRSEFIHAGGGLGKNELRDEPGGLWVEAMSRVIIVYAMNYPIRPRWSSLVALSAALALGAPALHAQASPNASERGQDRSAAGRARAEENQQRAQERREDASRQGRQQTERRAEAERRAEEARQAEEARRAEAEARAAEARRRAEEARRDQEARERVEEAREEEPQPEQRRRLRFFRFGRD